MATAPVPDLSHAFIGANPADYRIARVLMVGACLEKDGGLSQNDDALLRHAVRVLDQWRLPMSENLDAVCEDRAASRDTSVRVINILPEQGGEDFLGSKEKGDMVILCNIARDVDDDLIIRRGNMKYLEQPPSLRAAFSSSPDHNDIKAWQAQIVATDAKIVMVTNTDGFALSELHTGQFVAVSLGVSDNAMGMLVRRDYLAEVENYLMLDSLFNKDESPLLAIASGAANDPAARFGYNLSTRQTVEYGGPR